MSGKAVVEAKSLEERVAEKLADTIGDMITPEDMVGMVRKSVKKAIFTERPDPARSSQYHKIMKPSLIDEMVGTYLQKQMKEAVEAWIIAHPEDMQAAIGRAIDRGVSAALQRTLDDRFAGLFNSSVTLMQQQGLLPPGP